MLHFLNLFYSQGYSKKIQHLKETLISYRKSSDEKIAEVFQMVKNRPPTPEKLSYEHLLRRAENSKDMFYTIVQAAQFEQEHLQATKEALAKVGKEERAGTITKFMRSLFAC